MTIEELIKQLQQHDPKLPVILHGYEGGVCVAKGLHAVTIALNVNTEWYYGPHEIVYAGEDFNNFEKTTGVCLT